MPIITAPTPLPIHPRSTLQATSTGNCLAFVKQTAIALQPKMGQKVRKPEFLVCNSIPFTDKISVLEYSSKLRVRHGNQTQSNPIQSMPPVSTFLAAIRNASAWTVAHIAWHGKAPQTVGYGLVVVCLPINVT